MALGSRVMNRLAHLYEEDKNKNKYTQEASALADFDDLVRLHWSENSKVIIFCSIFALSYMRNFLHGNDL